MLSITSKIGIAGFFISDSTFNLAHWLFAFNDWALSWRLDLIKENKPRDSHDCMLNTVNIFFSFVNFLTPTVLVALDTNYHPE